MVRTLRHAFMVAVLLALASGDAVAQYLSPPTLPVYPSREIKLRRNWNAVTGTVDSTQFLLKRSTSDGTASGLRDTLNAIDVSTWFRFPQGSTNVAVGVLHVIFNNASTAGASGDSLGVEWQASYDGTNWTSVRTVEWWTQTAGAGYAAIPIWYDSDNQTVATKTDIGHARYIRALLLGDSSGKQVIAAVYESHFEGVK